MASTDIGGIGGGRFGEDKATGYVKPKLTGGSVGKRYTAGKDYRDDRFRTSGGMFPNRGLAQKQTGGFNFPFGGLGGGGGNVGFAWDDYDRQMALMDKIAEMGAGYSSTGTLGTTDIDYENKMITQKLSPALQAEYDALIDRTGLSREQVAEMQKDPRALQQYIYEQNLALKRPEQEDLRNQTLETLQAKGMLGSTGGAGLYGQVEESIARSNAMDFQEAMMQGQQLLDMERARGQQDLSTATAMGGMQIPFIQAGTAQGAAIPIGNVSGVSDASANIANLMGIEQGSKRKGLWDAMGMGGTSGGGGLFSKIVCTAMNDDYGFGAYRNAIWLRYAELNYKDKPEMEKGYHAIFKPLLKIRKKWYGKPIYALLKHIARHRSVDLRAEMYGKKRDRIGQAWRFVLEPLCYVVGKRLIKKL